MASIGLTVHWLREEFDLVAAQHHKFPCPRCRGRGFRIVRWFPCRLCGGIGFPRVSLAESSHRMHRLLDVVEERIRSSEALLGWVDERSRW